MKFGQIISEARKKANLSQKELAAKIKKEDGQPISPQYLNDIERDRRNPPSDYLMGQFSKVLNVKEEVLYYHAGELPPGDQDSSADQEKIVEAYKAFRKVLKGKK